MLLTGFLTLLLLVGVFIFIFQLIELMQDDLYYQIDDVSKTLHAINWTMVTGNNVCQG